MSRYHWKPYVPVAVRRARVLKKMAQLRKKGLDVQPVAIEGRKITRTFWGEAWCSHLESFSDYENRLPRGRTYVRNGSVCHLDIARGEVNAMVSGSALYKVKVAIKTLPRKKWKDIKHRCAGQVGSLLELLQGRLSQNVMSVVTDRNQGLFPQPGEIRLTCNCPDWAVMCKHVAAVLYGVGARLDERPDLLFLLRGVDHEEFVHVEVGVGAGAALKGGRRRIADDSLADVFGIEIPKESRATQTKHTRSQQKSTAAAKKTVKVKKKQISPRDKTIMKKKSKTGKTASARRIPAKKKSPTARSHQPVTGRDVAALRAKFDMTQSLFASLLGVSAPSISNWERKLETLNLQPRTRAAWNRTQKWTKRKAWLQLKGSSG